MEFEAINNLYDANIVEFALCKSPKHPSASFAILKSMDLSDGSIPIIKSMVFKADPEKKQVFGYVWVPLVPDAEGDVMTAAEVEKAAHGFMTNAFKGQAKGTGVSDTHVYFDGVSTPIESSIDTNGDIAKAAGVEPHPGGWWVGAQLSDEQWEKVEKGEFTGFSMGGKGKRTPIEKAGTNTDKGMIEKALETVAGWIKKGEGDAKSFDEITFLDSLYDELWEKLDQLHYSIVTIANDSEVSDKSVAIANTVDQFKASLIGALLIQKAGKTISKKNKETLDTIAKLAEAGAQAQAKLKEFLDNIETEDANKALIEGNLNMNSEELKKAVDAMTDLTKTVKEDIVPRLDTVEKAIAKKGEDITKSNDDDAKKKDDEGKKIDDIEKSLTDSIGDLTKSLKDIGDRLKKVEDTPLIQKGSSGSDYDDVNDDPNEFKPTGTDEEIALAKAGHSLLGGGIKRSK